MTLDDIKKDYLQQFKENDCRYIVLKMDDLMGSITNWGDWRNVQEMLSKYNTYRLSIHKPVNKYFVVNRDDFPKFKSADEFFNALKKLHDDYV